MTTPRGLRYTRTHEWVRVKGAKIQVGITDYAQAQMHDITNVELPEPDSHHEFHAGEEVGVLESVKAAADFHAPVAGIVTAVNADLLENPEFVNDDPYGTGWLFEMTPSDTAQLRDLMDVDDYEATLPEEDTEEE